MDTPLLEISEFAEAQLIAGARDARPVRGLTHNFYRYPARFSPAFARAAIEVFTNPGDLVVDNHVGGGTTLVEALTLGRDAIGVDISTLAEFVSTVKTTVYTEDELRRLVNWTKRLPDAIDARGPSVHFPTYEEAGYLRHLNHHTRWRLRKAIEQGLGSALRLGSARLVSFGRCVVLRTAQWALDGRKKIPTISNFRETLVRNAEEMIAGARNFACAVNEHAELPTVRVINRSAAGIEADRHLNAKPPKLVLTSPPYPGIHVLYHRWQVDGRKETPAPFWIANKLDGAGSSYYTMGDRKHPGLASYFTNIKATMSSVAALADAQTAVVQMVAFSDVKWQLPLYLEMMREAGLAEVLLSSLQGERDGRLWRSVPSRRWYSDQRGETPGSQEVVLIHRKAVGVAACDGEGTIARQCPLA